MIVRVVQVEDGPLAIVRPLAMTGQEMNEATQRLRIADGYLSDPATAGRPFVDVDDSELPSAPRQQWRIEDGRIVVRPARRRWWEVWA